MSAIIKALRSAVCTQEAGKRMASTTSTPPPRVVRTDDEWRAALSDKEFRVLRRAQTDRPNTGEHTKSKPKSGTYRCKGCNTELYSAESKFDAGCGWPAFDKAYTSHVKVKKDDSGGMERWEILCTACSGHLGHVFNGEGFTETNQRHCVNSTSLVFDPTPISKAESKI